MLVSVCVCSNPGCGKQEADDAASRADAVVNMDRSQLHESDADAGAEIL